MNMVVEVMDAIRTVSKERALLFLTPVNLKFHHKKYGFVILKLNSADMIVSSINLLNFENI